jgi:hypothetical protein
MVNTDERCSRVNPCTRGKKKYFSLFFCVFSSTGVPVLANRPTTISLIGSSSWVKT